jgi:hypothetical protein
MDLFVVTRLTRPSLSRGWVIESWHGPSDCFVGLVGRLLETPTALQTCASGGTDMRTSLKFHISPILHAVPIAKFREGATWLPIAKRLVGRLLVWS